MKKSPSPTPFSRIAILALGLTLSPALRAETTPPATLQAEPSTTAPLSSPSTHSTESTQSTTSTQSTQSTTSTQTTSTTTSTVTNTGTTSPTSVRLPSGVVYEVLQPGTGEKLTTGATAMIHYKLTSDAGQVWDNSRIRPVPNPFSFKAGTGKVVRGMDEGTIGMRVGERRTIHIPPELGYGSRQAGGIPPNSRLHFDVELVNIKPAEEESDAQTTGTE